MNSIGIVLAAGSSRRFGRNKLLEPLGSSSLLQQSVSNLLPHVQSVMIICNNNDAPIRKQLIELPVTFLCCPHASQGMAASLVYGIENSAPCDGWLITLGDMPFIQQSIYADIIHAAAKHSLIAPYFQGQRGHPIYFNYCFRDELLQLRGDEGAKIILQRHQPEIYQIESPNNNILLDVDYPQDLRPPL